MKLKSAFMPYVCCGDPSTEFTIKLVEKLVSSGADAVELGIPFSDPIADGKTIQAASARSLNNGMTPKKAIEIIQKLRENGIGVPLIVMTYYNIIYANGGEKFIKSIKEAGANAIIVPDVPLEESEELHRQCEGNDVDLVYLVTPNCDDERLKKIAEKSKGFLYAVAVLGITGTRENVRPEALELIKRAKKVTTLPLVVGFGVSNANQAKEYMKAGAEGIIVGSKIVDIYSKYLENEEKALSEIAKFTKEIKGAIDTKI
ncbi:tryptophan synthase subunit alpha [Candidatus Micrarchaeota archaeon]|nr:tryptophan synthase subunit alpha [Candidatus Micrarchaeota archaeon]